MNDALTVPRDPKLPQLARAVDAREMRQVFATALAAQGGRQVADCRVDRIKYRPGRNCTVSYCLEIDDGGTGRRLQQRVAGRFCAAGDAALRHARHRDRVRRESRCGLSAILVPELELFAWFLPNDPRLAALPGLCEVVERGGPPLAEAVAAMAGHAAGIASMSAGLVQYVPESRACARFAVHLADGSDACLFAKLDRDDGGARTHRVMQSLYDSAAAREGRLRTPRPLLWQANFGLHWQAAVAGVPLLDVHPLCPSHLAADVGRQLAALHATPVALARHEGHDQLLGRIRECAAMLATVDGSWHTLLDPLLRRLAAGIAEIGALPLATLHGDLHPRNILVDGRQLALIDLDGVRAGAAVLELGAWVADALCRALHAGTSLDAVQDSAAHLIEAYRASSAQTVPDRQLSWATARALLCDRAFRGVAALKPGRLGLVPTLLSLAVLIAERGDLEHPLPVP